ncbi:hypothetical protein LCGC14_2935770 [marine sediment metagenome]|uniref:HTH marR-type domain-containing protein n=1 Tax=marine sediment metagenome TaxID=412755 RepID=A0A0F9AAK9_9ZZZZ
MLSIVAHSLFLKLSTLPIQECTIEELCILVKASKTKIRMAMVELEEEGLLTIYQE